MVKFTVTQKARFDTDRIVRDMKEKAFSKIEDELRLLRCPVHHQAPTFNRTLQGKLELRTCCKTLLDAANARLGR